jgi:hypothetical protein
MSLAADSQRERALASLSRAYVSGRIDADELAARSERAVRARTTGDLRAVLRGLPRFDELIERGWLTARFIGYVAALAVVWAAASVFLLSALIVLALAGVGGLELLAVPSVWVVMSAVLAASALRAAHRR